MRKVIRIDEKEESKKPIELTHYHDNRGWRVFDDVVDIIQKYHKIVYLGKCGFDGDMFACYGKTTIQVCKGNLNDGVY